MNNQSLWNNDVIRAIKEGNLEQVQLCSTDNNTLPLDWDYAMDTAAELGHLNIVKYCESRGGKSFYLSMCFAAKRGYFNIVKYLAEKDKEYDWSYIVAEAAMNNHTEIIKYCESKGFIDYNIAMITAAERGHFELLKYFEGNSSILLEWVDITLGALRGGHQEIIEYCQKKLK